jgi:hypothetical protein
MTTPTIPTTMNEAHGFYGTMREHADAAWKIALPAIANATATEFEAVRLFLDSRHGRHFVDEVCNQMLDGLALEPAIHAAIERWMGWTIGRTISRDYGIPRGLPYLTGFVAHCEIVNELT